MRTFFTALSLLVLAAMPARATYVTGIVLLTYCQDETSNFCAGYLAGLVDYQELVHQQDVPSRRFCLPDNTKLSELRNLTVNELLRNPGDLRKLASSLLLPALVRQYPCP